MKTLLSFGHGYVAQALARRLIPQGWTILATTRDAEKARALAGPGVETFLTPDTDLAPLLQRASHFLVSAGPGKAGDPMLEMAQPAVAAAAASLQWAGYFSTTAVYGDHGGGWVDESTPLTPSTTRGEWRKAAEDAWRAIPALPLHIFRLAAIYGPERGPFEKVRAGVSRRIVKPGQVFSRIHVDDIVQVLEASLARPNPGRAYNLCDDDPAPPQDVIAYAAELLGLPVPPAIPFDDADLSPMARSFYAENKRIRNDRIKDELGVQLTYPDYRSGLQAVLRAGLK